MGKRNQEVLLLVRGGVLENEISLLKKRQEVGTKSALMERAPKNPGAFESWEK